MGDLFENHPECILLLLPLSIALIIPLFMYAGTFPVTIEGRITTVTHYTGPAWPSTQITFTNLGDEPKTITLYGEIDIKTGVTYRITYHTPFGHLLANLDSIEEVNP